MRWGILFNLATIFVVSGVLLFVVFSASLQRAVLDDKIRQAALVADLVESEIRNSSSSENLWQWVRRLCRARSGLRLVLYDPEGTVLGGCGIEDEGSKPDPKAFGRKIRVISGRLPTSLFKETHVVVLLTADFPHGIRSVAAQLNIPPPIFSPACRFFAAYLILTQLALFFIGYLLFHRTVIGPIRDVARLAGDAAGVTEYGALPDSPRFTGDIQRISASLRGMVSRIVQDRRKMEELVTQLREINRDLETAQQGLVRSEKMASVGRLAAGLAHELGNPLQIVMGYVELMERRSESEAQSEIISRMDRELKRIHDILQKLLEFARPAREHVDTCDINTLVTECEFLLKGRKGFRAIEFEEDLDPSLAAVSTEPEKLRQVLVNLMFNAADALPESGGKITLRTRKHENGFEITVEDSGSGIAQEDLEKVFDPFFTTKETGKGTGLGLTVCLGLVESLDGSIDIDSSPGEGTRIRVRIPG
ncbi:MAG: ATP-binding protein [Deltaproteobacteria bacterium]